MNRREVWLVLLLLGVASAAAAFHFLRDNRPSAKGDVHVRPGPSAEFAKEYVQVQAAEGIADKLQRCLAYPNPPEFHWDPKVVEAFCRLSLRSMLGATEINNALNQHQPDKLDKAFASYLQRNYADQGHGFLIWTYWYMFEGVSANIESMTRRWLDMDGDSPYALSARGTYLMAMAWKARGGKYASQTPAGNFAKMQELAAQAKEDFDRAIRSEPRMIAAYYGLMQLAQMTSDHTLFEDSMRKALALDPAEKWVYDRWMDESQPEWGGSESQMLVIAYQAASHASANPLLKLVAAQPYCHAAAQFYCSDCKAGIEQYRKALVYYRGAFAAGPAPCALDYSGNLAELIGGDDESVVRYDMQTYRFTGDTEKLLRSSLALQRLGKTDWALQSVDMLLKQWPKYVKAMLYRGWILESAHRATEAEHVFQGVLQIDPQNREANTELVGLYVGVLHQHARAEDIVERLMKADPSNPRAWLLEAALDKDGSVKQCKYDLEQYLSLVDTTTADDYERRDIGRAKARLAELKRVRIN